MRHRPAIAGTPVLAILAVVGLIAGACGPASKPPPTSGPSSSAANVTLFPVMITSPLVVGENRVLFSYLDQGNQPAAAPDRTAKVDFLPKDATEPVASTTGRFVWGIEDKAGIYVGHATLPSAGAYAARFTTTAAGTTETVDVSLDILQDDPAVGVGEPAPPSVTPTLADVGGDVAQISTDKDPEPRFYESSIKDAVESAKPFVVVFATPAFCQTQQCGPTLDRVKAVVAAYPDLTVINVEPYQLEMTDGSLQPVLTNNNLTPVQAVVDWNLQSEPWVYVVDQAGIVRSSLGLIFLDDELTAAIDEVTASS